MKKILTYILAITCFWACEKDDPVYDLKLGENGTVNFTAVPGGAKMNYELPQDEDLLYIEASYTTDEGKEVVKRGSYASREIFLDGFISDLTNVPLKVTLVNRKDTKSKVENYTFNTKKSIAALFMEKIKIKSYWTGFTLQYELDQDADALFHVAYVDSNKYTKQLDTILIETKHVEKGKHSIDYSGYAKPGEDHNDVVVWTENFKGRFVGRKVWPKLGFLADELMDPSDFDFIGPSEEIPEDRIGWEYLFDGDTKGTRRLENNYNGSYCFASKENCEGEPYIIDLKEAKNLSKVRFYCKRWADPERPLGHEVYQANSYLYMLPLDVEFWGSDDINKPDDEWSKLGRYEEGMDIEESESWTHGAQSDTGTFPRLDLLESAEEKYFQLGFPLTDNKYRYVKFVVHLANRRYERNPERRWTAHEIQIFKEKETK